MTLIGRRWLFKWPRQVIILEGSFFSCWAYLPGGLHPSPWTYVFLNGLVDFCPVPYIIKLLSLLMQTPFKIKILSTNGKHKLKVDISPFLFHTEVDLGTRNGDISYCNKGSEAGQREFRKRRLFKIRTKLGTVPSSLRTHRAPRYKITKIQASKFPDQRCFSQWSTSCSNVYTRPNRRRN